MFVYEPLREKTGLRGFRPGPTQTRLYNHTRWLEARNFVFRKTGDCTIYIAKTKALTSFAVTAKLICVFVFAYAKSRFSHDAAHMTLAGNLEDSFSRDEAHCIVYSVVLQVVFTDRVGS